MLAPEVMMPKLYNLSRPEGNEIDCRHRDTRLGNFRQMKPGTFGLPPELPPSWVETRIDLRFIKILEWFLVKWMEPVSEREKVSLVTRTVTADQLFQMRDDGFRYELVKGELRKMTPAGFKHGKVVANLTGPLTIYVRANNLGVVLGAETGFKIGSDPDTVRAPDVAFVRMERILATGETDKFWPGPPDLAVEVLSPRDTVYEVEEKVANWLTAGFSMVWVVNPKERTLHVHRFNKTIHRLSEKDLLDGQDVLPGFHLSITEIFD